MGRKRTKNKSYPPRFHVKEMTCYHVANPTYDISRRKPVRKWTRIGTVDDLPAALAKWASIENNTNPIEGDTIYDLAKKYSQLLSHPENPLRLKERTIKEFLRMLRLDPGSTLIRAFGKVPMSDIERHDIAFYLDEHPHPIAANREIALLSRMYRYAIRKGWTETNPCQYVEKNPEKPRDRYIEDNEYIAIREFCWSYTNKKNQKPWQALSIAMDISYLISIRLSDVINIQTTDYDDIELKIREGKTGWKARVRMSAELKTVLTRSQTLRRRTDTSTVIVNLQGRPYSDSAFKSAWQRMMKTAINKKVIIEKFTFHDIRAKNASDLHDQEINAQLQLGHITAEQTAAYIRSRKGRRIDTLKSKIVETTSFFVENEESDNS